MSKSFAHILSLIQENNVEMVNLKITDAEGQFHQVTIPSEGFSMDLLKDGINIDTSTYVFVESGKGDAIFIPDPDTAAVDADSMISTVVIAGQLRFFGSNAEPDTKPSKFARIISQTLSLFALLSGLTVFFYVLPRWLIVCCCGGVALATPNIEGMSLSIALAGMLVLLVGEIIAFIIGLVGLILAMIGKKIAKK